MNSSVGKLVKINYECLWFKSLVISKLIRISEIKIGQHFKINLMACKNYMFVRLIVGVLSIYNIFSLSACQEIDNEALLREIDFSELEEKFELPKRVESHESQQKRKHALLRANNQVCFIDGNRAKNMGRCSRSSLAFSYS